MSPTNTNGFSSNPAAFNPFNVNSNLSPSHHHLTSILPHRQQSLSSASSHHAALSSDIETGGSPLLSKFSNTPQNLITMLGTDNNNTKLNLYERCGQTMPPTSLENLQAMSLAPTSNKEKDVSTPTSTPTTSRKSRRRSNLFIPSSKKDDKLKNCETDKLGSGRSIPLKQGYLYKRSSKTLNKEWKKKYVTLCDDGRLTYHSSLHDYMDNVHGKEISLQYVTVKVPGQKPRGSKSIITNSALTKQLSLNKNGVNNINNNNTVSLITESIGVMSMLKDKKSTNDKYDKHLLSAHDNIKEPGKTSSQSGDESSGVVLSTSNSQNLGSDGNVKVDIQTPNVKKRHRRMKSSGIKNNEIEGMQKQEFK